jgi:UDP:flavonoid glycosyltransferase YjiC (YdhE family)
MFGKHNLLREILDRLRHLDAHFVLLTSPLGRDPSVPAFVDLPPSVSLLNGYPVAHLLSGFDLVITAAGMNSFVETARSGAPAIYIAKPGNAHSDQPGILRTVAELDLGIVCEDLENLPSQFTQALNRRQKQPPPSEILGNGNRRAAQVIAEASRAQ